MRQQINLYQPIFREERKALAASSVGVGLTLLIAGLTVVSIYAKRRVAELEITVQALREQTDQQQAQLAQAAELTAKRAQPVDLEARIKQMGMTVGERERALQVLESGAAGQTAGFAARLEALARRHVAGIWLDGMKLSGTGPSMLLQGATVNPDLVPLYLSSLAADAVLAGTRFDEFVIQRAEPSQQQSPRPETGTEANGPDAAKPATRASVRFSAGSSTLARSSEPQVAP